MPPARLAGRPQLRTTFLALLLAGGSATIVAAAARRAGAPDPAFGTLGITRSALGGTPVVTGLARQPNGKLVVACRLWRPVGTANTPHFGLVRYTAAGALDTTFGQGGLLLEAPGDLAPSGSGAWCRGVRTDPQGRILAVGAVYAAPNTRFVLARYTPDGLPDETFGTNGKVIGFAGPSAELFDVAVQNDGSVLTVGSGSVSGERDLMLLRYDSLGRPDPDFGSGGRVITSFTVPAGATGVALRPGGTILVSGWAGTNACLAQFRPDGTLDPAFGSGGKAVLDVANGEDYLAGLALQRDGRAVAAGVATLQVGSDWTQYPVLCRITSAGEPDRSFGKRGVFRGAAGGSFTDLALQRDGKAVTSGLAAGRLTISRFTRAGKPDTSFGTRGSVALPAGGAAESGAILVEPAGKIVAATATLVSDTSDEELVITRRLSR